MANKPKKGLDYFPMDVNLFSDIKVRKLIKYQGGKAVTVYAHLLCNIYKDGYYLVWDNELPFMIAEDTAYDEAYVQEVIKCCLKVELFSQNLFEVKGVLTSRGLQIRYENICKLSKRKAIISEYSLIHSEELPINSEDIGNNSEELPQRKEKESKVKERKEKKREYSDFFDLKFIHPDFQKKFFLWLNYLKTEHDRVFKSAEAIQECYDQMLIISNKDPLTAEKVIKKSMANRWKTLVELSEKKIIDDKTKPPRPAATGFGRL